MAANVNYADLSGRDSLVPRPLSESTDMTL